MVCADGGRVGAGTLPRPHALPTHLAPPSTTPPTSKMGNRVGYEGAWQGCPSLPSPTGCSHIPANALLVIGLRRAFRDYSPLDSCLWLPPGRKFYYYCIYKNQHKGRAGKVDTFYKMWKTEFPWIRISGGCLFTRCGLCEFLKGTASAAKSNAVRDTIIYRFSPIWPISSHSFNFISRPSIMSACASDVNVAPFRWFLLQ